MKFAAARAVSGPYKLKLVKEGDIKFFASPGLGKDAFYNPAAELQRDIGVAAAQAWQRTGGKPLNVLDATAGAGARGLRYAKEVSGVMSVVLNDKNPAAVSAIKKNIRLNKLSKLCRPSHSDANLLLHQKVFNFIDIDPYGSPNLFLDAAARSIWHRGFLAVTATDTAPLSGVYPLTTLQKYGIVTFNGAPFYSELGLRTLVSFVILKMARRGHAFVPLLSHATRHYFRAYGKIEHTGKLKSLLKQFGFLSYNEKTGEFKCGERPESDWKFSGPLYLGPLGEKEFILDVLEELQKRDFRLKTEETKLLKLLLEESEARPFYYDLHVLASLLHKGVPNFFQFTEKLRRSGYAAIRTHFSNYGIKTGAPFSVIKKTLH